VPRTCSRACSRPTTGASASSRRSIPMSSHPAKRIGYYMKRSQLATRCHSVTPVRTRGARGTVTANPHQRPSFYHFRGINPDKFVARMVRTDRKMLEVVRTDREMARKGGRLGPRKRQKVLIGHPLIVVMDLYLGLG
jgi:hypothetical protein